MRIMHPTRHVRRPGTRWIGHQCLDGPLVLVAGQAAFLTAGQRWAGPARRPLGRPGERPQGFGVLAGEPTAHNRRGNPRRTRKGDCCFRAGAAPTAAADRRRPGGPGAAGCGRPPTARSSARPARDGGGVAWSSPGSAWRTGRCAPDRACERTPVRSTGPARMVSGGVRSLAATTTRMAWADRRDVVDHRHEHDDIGDVGRGDRCGQRQTAPVADQVELRPRACHDRPDLRQRDPRAIRESRRGAQVA
jgi:hypothetical protein